MKLIYMKEVLDTMTEEVFNTIVKSGNIKFNKKETPYLVIDLKEKENGNEKDNQIQK